MVRALQVGVILMALLAVTTPAVAAVWEPFSVTAPDGLVSPGLIALPGGTGPHPLVVYVHGAPGGRGAAGINTLATTGFPALRWQALLDAGIAVCIADWRATPPNRPGDAVRGSVNAIDDVSAILDHLFTRGDLDPMRTGILGASMGGAITIHLGLRRPLGPLVLDYPASHVVIDYFGPQSTGCLDVPEDSEIDLDTAFVRVAPISRPVLILQGTNDGLCALNVKLNEILGRAGKDTSLVTYPDAPHGFTNGPDNADARDAMARTTTFFAATLAPDAQQAAVSGLAARHHHGQTFLTWNSPAGTGWRYRVYQSSTPISSSVDLAAATLVATVGDSTSIDRRLSSLRGQTFGYVIDSGVAPLLPAQGLAVLTQATDGVWWYAVTAQPAGGAEDLLVTPGGNALTSPVNAVLDSPEPIFQRTLTQGPLPFDVYTLWTSPYDTPLFPAMGTQHGLAFDCAVVRGLTGGPLLVRPHARGGNFLNNLSGSGEPGEWRLTLDDWLFDSSDRNSFWYGYHDGYDLFDATPTTPVSGSVTDYTLRRMVHTLAWARRAFPVDTLRVHATGGSMGGIGSLALAYRVPQWLGAIHITIPKFDFSFTNDPNPANAWNAGSPERLVGDHLWGSVAANLTTHEGMPVYDRLDLGTLAGRVAGTSLPVILAFNGKNDTVVGWAEKIPYYAATQLHRHGGQYFWDQRTHSSSATAGWSTMENLRNVYAFRVDRSYPALSNCSADSDPGDGHATSGDSLGSLNGSVTWDTEPIDDVQVWQTTLRPRDLVSRWGPVPAPDSFTVDVTPRRTQRFLAAPGQMFAWQVTRLVDEALIQGGWVTADSLGLVTVPGARIVRPGSVVRIVAAEALDVTSSAPARAGVSLVPSGFVATSSHRMAVHWRAGVPGEVALIDVSGRRAATLLRCDAPAPVETFTLDPSRLAPGVWFVIARQGSERATTRVVILR